MPGLLCLDRFLWSSFGKYTTKSFISLTALKINGCVFLNTPHNKEEDKEKGGGGGELKKKIFKKNRLLMYNTSAWLARF